MYCRLGGWTFGHTNKYGKSDTDLSYIKKGFIKIWQVFNESSEILKFDWQDVVNNATLVTENDTFVPNDPTVFDSFEKMFEYMDIEDGTKVGLLFNRFNDSILCLAVHKARK